MNVKVANLVAIQLGVLVGIVSWLAYSRFESAEPRIAAVEIQKRPVNSVAAAAPISDLGSQVTRALDDGADGEQDHTIGEQPAPAAPSHQYSPEAVQQYTALAAQQYYQQIAPRRYASTGVASTSAPVAPAYTEVAQEPAAVSSDYAEPLQTVAYAEPNQVVVYQPQFIVFSNQHRFPNRCRPTLQPAAVTPVVHRGPGRGRPHVSGSRESRPTKCFETVSPRNPNDPSCRPSQESERGGSGRLSRLAESSSRHARSDQNATGNLATREEKRNRTVRVAPLDRREP